jgi:hypothetical protein
VAKRRSFADENEANAILGAIVGRYNDMLRQIDHDEFDPIFWAAHNGTLIAADWAEGFLHAIMLRMDAWKRLLNSKRDGQLLLPILALCGDENGESLLDMTQDEEDRFMEEAGELIPPASPRSPPTGGERDRSKSQCHSRPDCRRSQLERRPRSAVTIRAPAALAKSSKNAAAKLHKQHRHPSSLPNAYDIVRDSGPICSTARLSVR